MLRSFIKTSVATAVHWSGGERLLGGQAGYRQPVVLGYHRVVDDFTEQATHSIPALLVSRAMLERHLDWIARRFHVVSLEELESRMAGSPGSARPLAAITFDDGYRDVYEHAFPLLKQKGIPAAVFVVTDLVGTSRMLPHDRLYLLLQRAFAAWRSPLRELTRLLLWRLGIVMPEHALAAGGSTAYAALRTLVTALPQADLLRVIDALEDESGPAAAVANDLRPVTWEMLAEMSRAGITVGSHTKSHVLLTNEDLRKVIDETTGSRQELERRLGRPVTCFAYPDGGFDALAVQAVAAAGYRVAITTCHHRDFDHPWLTVPRVMLWERSSMGTRGRFSAPILSCQLNRAFDVFSGCRRSHGRPCSNQPYGERHPSHDQVQRTASTPGR